MQINTQTVRHTLSQSKIEIVGSFPSPNPSLLVQFSPKVEEGVVGRFYWRFLSYPPIVHVSPHFKALLLFHSCAQPISISSFCPAHFLLVQQSSSSAADPLRMEVAKGQQQLSREVFHLLLAFILFPPKELPRVALSLWEKVCGCHVYVCTFLT